MKAGSPLAASVVSVASTAEILKTNRGISHTKLCWDQPLHSRGCRYLLCKRQLHGTCQTVPRRAEPWRISRHQSLLHHLQEMPLPALKKYIGTHLMALSITEVTWLLQAPDRCCISGWHRSPSEICQDEPAREHCLLRGQVRTPGPHQN